MNTWKESQQTVPGPIYCCQEYPSYTCLRQVEKRARTSDSREVYCRSWESNRPVFICHLSKLRKLFPDLYNRVGSESQFREYVVAEWKQLYLMHRSLAGSSNTVWALRQVWWVFTCSSEESGRITVCGKSNFHSLQQCHPYRRDSETYNPGLGFGDKSEFRS